MTRDVTAALSSAAQTIYNSARSHKRAEAQHRRQARELMRRLDALRDQAAVFGIELHIDTDRP